MFEFIEFPKMARLSRECRITEKIDGTNAQVTIVHMDEKDAVSDKTVGIINGYMVYAGSRSRWITAEDDNYGFAKWVVANLEELVTLGPGSHFGEWWGSGIQRNYGLKEKRFSLFNTVRWIVHESQRTDPKQLVVPDCCHIVPELYRGIFNTDTVENVVNELRRTGSRAAPGFLKPEGVVVYHVAAGVPFKKLLEKDELPKGLAEKA